MARGIDRSGYLARYVCSHSPALGSATLPQGSIYSSATSGFGLLEVIFSGTTSSAKRVQLRRLTSAGTPGTGSTEVKYDDDATAPLATVFLTHTGAPGLGDAMHLMPGEAVSGSCRWAAFHDDPLEVAVGTANGLGLLRLDANTGGADVHWVWEE